MIEKILERLEAVRQMHFDLSQSDELNEHDKGLQRMFVGCYKHAKEIVQEVAKEHGRKLNRCDTCTHYTSEEIVPPICYFCCKGLENNYKARESE